MATVTVLEYTDPGCPFAYSAEPVRRRLDWLYGEHLDWELRLVGLADTPEQYLERGFTPERQAASFERLAAAYGMPINTSQRPRMAATRPACLAVVATRLRAPDRARAVLRALRVHHFAGDALLDEPAMRALAAQDAGLDPADLEEWMADPAAEAALAEDMAAARSPTPVALALDHKLAGPPGHRRYTCPSYELVRHADGARLSAPGFQPAKVSEVALANLLPEVKRRPAPAEVGEVLSWAGEPLATREVAAVAEIEPEEAREELVRIAAERRVGTDSFWSLTG